MQFAAPGSIPLLRERIIPALVIVLVTFAVFAQVIHHPFANYDDGEYVEQNQMIHGGVTLGLLRWALVSLEHDNWHPVTWISHALDWQFFGPNPEGHHATSLLFHIVAALLLFFSFSELTGSSRRSFLVALLFATHPLSVESVAWIAERKNILATLFFLSALWAYACYTRRPRFGWYSVVALLFMLSLASKAMTVTFPFALLLLDYWPLQRIRGWTEGYSTDKVPQYSFAKLVAEKLPFCTLSIADSIITVVAQHDAIHEVALFPLALRLQNGLVAYVSYLWNAFWPTSLSVLYPFPCSGLPVWKIVASALFLITATVLVWLHRSHGYLVTGWCWFLGTLIPVIGLIQVGEQAMADRYAYLPMVGIYLLVVWGIADLAQKSSRRMRPAFAMAAVVGFAFLAAAAWSQVRVWRSNIALWSHAVAVTPNNPGAEDALGTELLTAALDNGPGYSDDAVLHFKKALEMRPQDPHALFSIAIDLRARHQPAEALQDYKLAYQYTLDPTMQSQIAVGIASCYEMLGDFSSARQYYKTAMQGPSGNSEAFVGYARTFTDEQILKVAQDLAHRETAQARWQLGQLQEAAGRPADAIQSYRRAVELDPQFRAARESLYKLESSSVRSF